MTKNSFKGSANGPAQDSNGGGLTAPALSSSPANPASLSLDPTHGNGVMTPAASSGLADLAPGGLATGAPINTSQLPPLNATSPDAAGANPQDLANLAYAAPDTTASAIYPGFQGETKASLAAARGGAGLTQPPSSGLASISPANRATSSQLLA